MQHAIEGERLRPVDDETRGQEIKRRREAFRMTVTELAERVMAARGENGPAMDWQTVDRAEAGRSRGTAYAELEKALDSFEDEITSEVEPEPEHSVEFIIEGLYGADRVRVKGPVSDLREIEQSVARLMRLRQSQQSEE